MATVIVTGPNSNWLTPNEILCTCVFILLCFFAIFGRWLSFHTILRKWQIEVRKRIRNFEKTRALFRSLTRLLQHTQCMERELNSTLPRFRRQSRPSSLPETRFTINVLRMARRALPCPSAGTASNKQKRARRFHFPETVSNICDEQFARMKHAVIEILACGKCRRHLRSDGWHS